MEYKILKHVISITCTFWKKIFAAATSEGLRAFLFGDVKKCSILWSGISLLYISTEQKTK